MRGTPRHAGPYTVSVQLRGGEQVFRVGVSTSVIVAEVGSLPRADGCGVRGDQDEGEAVHGRA